MSTFTAGGVELIAKGYSSFMGNMGKAAGATDAFGKSTEKAAATSSKSARQMMEVSDAAKAVGGALTVAGAAATALFAKMATDAAALEGITRGFDAMSASAGLSLDALREAASGTVADMELMRLANVALTGAGEQLAQEFGQNLPRLLEIARAAARATGQDVGFLFQSLVTGIKRTSPMLIDNTGLQLRMGEANEQLAESLGKTVEELSAEEKQIAILRATMAAGVSMVEQFGGGQATAAENIARTKAEISNLATSAGQVLLPALNSVLGGVNELVGGFQALPDPVQQTAVQMAAIGGALASVAGGVALAVPKIQAMIGALQALGGASLLGPVGLVAGLAAALLYLQNMENAHQQEAASILQSSNSYASYTNAMREAGLESKTLSEGLYEVAKAAGDAGTSIDALSLQKARDELTKNVNALDMNIDRYGKLAESYMAGTGYTVDFTESLQAMVDQMTDLQLVVAQDEQEMYNLAAAMGMGAEESAAFVESITTMAVVEAALRDRTVAVESSMATLGARMPQVSQALTEQATAAAMTTEQIDALKKAYEDAMGAASAFIGTLAGGLVSLGDLDTAATESARDYESALASLRTQAGEAYTDIADKYESSLPDPTDVQTRLTMTADAWDEWALRMGALMDGVQGTTEQGWLDTINQTVAGTDMAWQQGEESLGQWLTRLQEAFYAGDLQGLINADAAAWQKHAGDVAAAQQAETAAVQAEQAKKKAALDQARQEEIAAQQAARDQAMLELALGLAESQGMLAAWATTLGPEFAGAFDTAAEVLTGLQSGIITLDGPLADMVARFAGGVNAVYDETRAGASTLADDLRNVLQGVDDAAAASAADVAAAVEEELSTMGDDVSVEEAKAAGERLGEAMGTSIEDSLPDDPLGGMVQTFDAGAQTVITMAGNMTAAIQSIPAEKTTDVKAQGAEKMMDDLRQIIQLLGQIPTEVKTKVSAEYDSGGEMTDPQSPQLGIEHALESLVDFVDSNFPIRLAFDPVDTKVFESYSSAITSMIQALRDIAGYAGGLPGLQSLEADLILVLDMITKLQGRSNTIMTAGAGNKNAEDLGTIFGWVQKMAEAVQAIAAPETMLNPGRISQFFDDVSVILDSVRDLWAEMLDIGEDSAAVFPFTNVTRRLAAAMEPLGIVADAMVKMAQYESVGSDRLRSFMADLIGILVDVADLATQYQDVDAAAATRLAVVLAVIGSELGDAAEGMIKISEYTGLADGALEALTRDLPRVLDAMLALAASYDGEGVDAADDFADAVGDILDSAGQAAEGMLALADYASLSQDSIDAFETDMARVLRAIVRVMGQFDAQGVIAAEEMSDAAMNMVGSIGRAVGGLADLAMYRGVSAASIDRFAADLASAVERLRGAFAAMPAADLEQMGAVGAMLDALGSGIGAATGALVDVGTYRGGIGLGLNAFTADIVTLAGAYMQLGYLLPDPEEAATIGETLESLGGGVQAAFDALVSIGTYRGGIGAALDAFISDLYALVSALDALGAAMPWWLVPGSPTPLEIGLGGINAELRELVVPLGAVAANQAAQNISLNFGPNHIANGMDMAQFGARTAKVVRGALNTGGSY